jgi:hypothetical protein
MPIDNAEPLTEAEGCQENQPASKTGFDSYRSLAYPNVRIIVAKGVVPPFRFKAGGWELSRSSIEAGSATQARITENGFFMFCINEDQTSGIELTTAGFWKEFVRPGSRNAWPAVDRWGEARAQEASLRMPSAEAIGRLPAG